MPGPRPLSGWRVAAKPAALDGARWPAGALVLRLAPDEALVVTEEEITVADPHAIVEPDAGFAAFELGPAAARPFLSARCDWDPSAWGLSQGLVAGIPAKVWRDSERVLLIVPTPFAHEISGLIG